MAWRSVRNRGLSSFFVDAAIPFVLFRNELSFAFLLRCIVKGQKVDSCTWSNSQVKKW